MRCKARVFRFNEHEAGSDWSRQRLNADSVYVVLDYVDRSGLPVPGTLLLVAGEVES